MQVMSSKSGESTEVLCQMVKATAVYLANLLISNEDIFSDSSKKDGASPTEAQLKTLYGRAYNLASPSSDASLRIAAIRLLAALIATWPPPRRQLDTDSDMELITVSTLFRTITTPSSDNTSSLEQRFVIVGALKALTKNGTEIEGLNGLVGWLVRALGRTTDEFTRYCSSRDDVAFEIPDRSKVRTDRSLLCFSSPADDQVQPFAPIKPATAVEVVSSIIDLLHAIVSNNIGLFGPTDIVRVVQPMLDMAWLGIAAQPAPDRGASLPIIPGSAVRRGSPASTALSSPGGSNPTFGLGFDHIRSASLSRTRATVFSNSTETSSSATPSRPVPPALNRATTVAATSPTASTTGILLSPLHDAFHGPAIPPRWTSCFVPLCGFLETLLNETPLPNDLFTRIITLICLAFGQDDSDIMSEEAWTCADQVLDAALGPNGGRRGELAIRTILEGKSVTISNNRSLKMPEEDRKIARGAVM